jgi:hypothetical protein
MAEYRWAETTWALEQNARVDGQVCRHARQIDDVTWVVPCVVVVNGHAACLHCAHEQAEMDGVYGVEIH